MPVAARATLLILLISAPASALLLWSMTLEVTESHFRFWFGPGLLRKSVPSVSVSSCEVVEGILAWGIHWAGKRGWLYNVSGRRAVALTLSNGKTFMVGTDEPELVCEALAQAKAAFKAGEGARA